MKIKSLGHVVIRVSDRKRAETFYGDLLGLPICARLDEGGQRMTFFTLGDHHNFAVSEVSGEGGRQGPSDVGLDHVAFRIGDNLDQLREAKALLESHGVVLKPVDHEITKSLYFRDPDGNGVELYVDVSDAWRHDPQKVAQGEPMVL